VVGRICGSLTPRAADTATPWARRGGRSGKVSFPCKGFGRHRRAADAIVISQRTMKITNKDKYDEFQNFSIVRLTQIGILANKLFRYLNLDTDELHNRIESLNSESLLKLPNLMEVASKEGYKTFGDYKKLEELDPKRVEQIFMQNSLQQSKLWNEVHLSLHQNMFPHITWSSLFLISMSHFEYSLILLSKFFQDEGEILLTVKDISGQSIYDKFVTYCLKALILKYNFGNSENWVKVKRHQKIRNLIVHNNGIIDDSSRSKSIKKLIDSNQINIKYNENNNIEVTKIYLDEVINDLQNWLIEFFKVVQ
jgi:hypothetical protein